jgi:hypothetical protein
MREGSGYGFHANGNRLQCHPSQKKKKKKKKKKKSEGATLF